MLRNRLLPLLAFPCSSGWLAFRLKSSSNEIGSEVIVPVKGKKRVVFDPERFTQPGDAEEEPVEFPYVRRDPHEAYYRRRFYPEEIKQEQEHPALLAGWRKRGGEEDYGRSFRESRKTRDAFVQRYGVEALNPVGKLRPLLETNDPGDLDDEKYFDEKEYIYEPLKPRLRQNVPRTMKALVKSLGKFAREGNHFLAAEILDEGADCSKPDHSLWSPLYYACDRGHYQMVNLFLMKSPNVDLLDRNGYSPLMIAAENGHFRVCQLLIQAKADLNICDMNGRTALLLAALCGYDRVLTLLIDSGADIHAVDKDGWSALHWSCFIGCLDAVQQLVRLKANINIKDREGNSPLHLSVAGGFLKICELLMEKGADHRSTNNNGWTPGHMAVHWAQSKALLKVISSKEDLEIQNNELETIDKMAENLEYRNLIHHINLQRNELENEDEEREAKSLIPLSENAEALNVVTLKVGGKTFIASKGTLEVVYGSYFWMMLHPEEGGPIWNKINRPELGPGPGPELQETAPMEFVLDRNAKLFSYILDFLRHLKYSNLREPPFPVDKYELGMLIEEAKFFRLPAILNILKSHRITKQVKSFRNVIPKKQRKKLTKGDPFMTNYGKSYLSPSVEKSQGNRNFQKWDPMNDPFAQKIRKNT